MARSRPDGEYNLASYAYDAFSRLISRSVGVSPTTATANIHDGWNRIAEYEINNQNSTIVIRKSYLWGPDLSGTFQGAGGVGGLLSVNTIGGSIHYPTFDGNGNITEYLTAAGAVAAHFEYDPFGNTVASTDATNQFEYRFSTKPIDSATGLFYYGYRWFDPLTGRWPSRDPMGLNSATGEFNEYAFIRNSTNDFIDILGLRLWGISGINSLNGAGNGLENYIGKKLESLGIKLDKKVNSELGTENFYKKGKNVFNPRSKEMLDEEAERKASQLCPGKWCGKKICVLMIAPKTATRPPSSTCCNLDIRVWWSPKDTVPNQGLNGELESKDYWSGWGGKDHVYTVDTSANQDTNYKGEREDSHSFEPYLHENNEFDVEEANPFNPGGGEAYRMLGGKKAPNPLDVLKDMQISCDETIICHSQGCNITMKMLQRACSK